jgi:hypothetical protein
MIATYCSITIAEYLTDLLPKPVDRDFEKFSE